MSKRLIMIDVPKNKYVYTVVLGDLSEKGKLQNALHTEVELPTETEVREQAQSEYRSMESWSKFIAGAQFVINKIHRQIK